MYTFQATIFAALLVLVAGIANAENPNNVKHDPAANLADNECFARLSDSDKVIITAAFHSGAEGFTELQELIARKPWGEAVTTAQRKEIATLEKQASPFLIMTLTKKQALVLEEHRDLIKWILVQSTTTPCT